jgi:hypothetical protein
MVLDAHLQFLRDERTEARRIEHSGHPDDALARKSAHFVGGLGHGVERVGNDDEDAIGRHLYDLAHHIFHDVVVGIEQVVAAHARLARDAGGNHHDVGICRIGIVVRADHIGIPLLDRHGLSPAARPR